MTRKEFLEEMFWLSFFILILVFTYACISKNAELAFTSAAGQGFSLIFYIWRMERGNK